MKIGLGCDHGGYNLKLEIIKHLEAKGIECVYYGTNSADESVDYPIYGQKVAEAVIAKEVDYGIAICGSGIGISIACNKVKGVRCAKVNNTREAKLCRKDNNANIIALNEKMHVFEAKDIIDTFLKTEYKKEERYQRRIDKISKYEEK